MRVLHVDSGREYRGGQDQVRLLVRDLAREPDVEQRLVTKRGSELARRVAAEGATVCGAPWTIGPDPVAGWRLLGRTLAFRPDILHAHNSHALAVALAARWLVRACARSVEPPRLVATRRVDFHLRRRSAWAGADRVIAISEAVKAVLVTDGLSAQGISVVPSGVDPEEVRRAAARPLDIRARLGVPRETPLAVNVAALVDHKDQRTLIRAAAAARTIRPDLQWAIAGEGDRRASLAALITRLRLGDRVHLLGYVPEADALIREADVFVMSSKEEGLGSVVLRALALGRPVVATRAGGLPEIVPPQWLVPVGDADALARRVVEALASPSPSPLPPRFTAAAMARGVLDVYRSLV